MEMRTWTFGELEAALAQTHQISSAKRTAFQARLKNFHRHELEFPPGFSAIKGKAAQYTGKQCCEIALVVELAQIGVSPDRAIRIHAAHASQICAAMIDAVRTLLSNDHFPLLLIFDPAGLADLQDRAPELDEAGIDDAVLTFQVMKIGELDQQFANWTEGYFRRAALINLTNMIDDLSSRLAEISRIHEGEVRQSFLESLKASTGEANGNP